LLVSDLGFLKVADFGLAKCTITQTYTACGTPEYFAPEIIASTGHTYAVDWWTLGVIIFEWMTGYAPFEAESPLKIFGRIQRGFSAIRLPTNMKTGDVGTLVAALLKPEPSERLPCLLGGIDNIKNHNWYSPFDWDSFGNQSMSPPYKPKLDSVTDCCNFAGVNPLDMPPTLAYEDDGSGWDADFET